MAMGMARGLALAALLAAPAAAQDADAGAALYRRHCAMCHGIDAMGQGPMAGVLTVQPTDLTRLAAGSGGVFPWLRAARRIDGRDPLVAHGSQMPVWGDFFDSPQSDAIRLPDGQVLMAPRPVADLLGYLASVQRAD